ncbi:MAG: hypothetical protein ACTS46_00270 [Candidatus Hodgkinia cicadicola]
MLTFPFGRKMLPSGSGIVKVKFRLLETHFANEVNPSEEVVFVWWAFLLRLRFVWSIGFEDYKRTNDIRMFEGTSEREHFSLSLLPMWEKTCLKVPSKVRKVVMFRLALPQVFWLFKRKWGHKWGRSLKRTIGGFVEMQRCKV